MHDGYGLSEKFIDEFGLNEKKDRVKYSYKYSSQQFISGKGLENLYKKDKYCYFDI